MKKIFTILIFSMINTVAKGQYYFPVTHMNGVVNIGCTDVTATPSGLTDIYNYCSPPMGPYWIAAYFAGGAIQGTGAYKWDINPGATAITIDAAAITNGEALSVEINNVHVNFSTTVGLGLLHNYPVVAGCFGLPLPSISAAGDLIASSTVVDRSARIIIGPAERIALIGGALINSVKVTSTVYAPYPPLGPNGVGVSFGFVPSVNAPSPIIVPGPVACSGGTITLSDAVSGGVWSCSPAGIANINSVTGVLTGVSTGIATVFYTTFPGCFTTATVSVGAPITGTTLACTAETITLSNAIAGGIWSSSNPAIAAVNSTTGDVTGVSAGTAVITYTMPTGCISTTTVTINPQITGPSLVCTGSTITLSDATLFGTWSSSNPMIANIHPITGVLTGLSAGTVVITYTMLAGCAVTYTVTVEDAASLCSPCHQFTSPYTTLSGGTIGSMGTPTILAPGNYYLTGDLYITGNVTMTDVIMMIDPGVRIWVEHDGWLTLKGCHLYCCGDMWGGITLKSDATETGKISLLGNTAGIPTLLEEAITAIGIKTPLKPNGGGYFIYSNNAVFNRNYTGMQIPGYTPATVPGPNPLEYEFHIENTVFTNRLFDNTTVPGYPATWPKTTGPGGLKATWTSSPYVTPFNASQYPAVAVPAGGLSVGIELINVGQETLAGYAGVKVGQANTTVLPPPDPANNNVEMNLFDNMNMGIRAENANLRVHNTAFAACSQTGPVSTDHDMGGEGIYATTTNGGHYKLDVEPSYFHWGPLPLQTRESVNSFYNCKWGVYALNYYLIKGSKSFIISDQTNGPGTNNGSYGYDIQTWPYRDVTLTDNTIVNIANGMSVKILTGGQTWYLQMPPQMTITGNKIRATFATGLPPGVRYVDNAIWVENAINYLHSATPSLPALTRVNVDRNELGGVYNGIQVNGVEGQPATSDNNKITMAAYPGGSSASQYAIRHTNCLDDGAVDNTISGPGYGKANLYGIMMEGSTGHMVGCNEVSNVGTGYEFRNTYINSNWVNNDVTNAQRGMTLNSSNIGVQGSATYCAGNRWLANPGFAWASGNRSTYTINSDPNNSTMWIYPGSFTPSNNNGSVNISSTWYGMGGSSGNGLNMASNSSISALCSPYILPFLKVRNQLLNFTVRQEIKYTLRNTEQQWMSQYTAWQVLMQYPVYFDESKVMTSFKKAAAGSRYGLLTSIEHELAGGAYGNAASLLEENGLEDRMDTTTIEATGVVMADGTGANRIVGNYRRFYQIYINYEQQALTGTDSVDIAVMAALCPTTDGGVVYKARALYDIVFDTIRIFEDVCDTGVADTMAPGIGQGPQDQYGQWNLSSVNDGGQKYMLYPNPNDGNFMLQQAVANKEPVEVEIWDAVGRSMYKVQTQFVTDKIKLQIGKVPAGAYMLQITDKGYHKFRFKFVVR